MDFRMDETYRISSSREIKVVAKIVKVQTDYIYYKFVTTLPDLTTVESKELFKIFKSDFGSSSDLVYNRVTDIPFNILDDYKGNDISRKIQIEMRRKLVKRLKLKIKLMNVFNRPSSYITFNTSKISDTILQPVLMDLKQLLNASNFSMFSSLEVGNLRIGYIRISVDDSAQALGIPKRLQRKLLRKNKRLKHRVDNL